MMISVTAQIRLLPVLFSSDIFMTLRFEKLTKYNDLYSSKSGAINGV